ncbi:MAG TPA: hypothetical protein VFH33_06105, partial [Candidatus Krumholzibacteria bacterium]|nr:hypothetical protein [Candidatus Krumholzibacteria bacterium]
MPQEVRESMEGKCKFQFKHAWLEKTRQIKENRDRYIEERGFYRRDMINPSARPQYSVSGTFNIPIFCVKFSATGADPFPIASLQTKLFNGPFAPETMTQFYTEISYGDLTVNGTVYGWTTLPNTQAFYAGAGTCNGLCGTSQVKSLITTTLAA